MDPFNDDELEVLDSDEIRLIEDRIAAGVCPECEGRLVNDGDSYQCAACGWDECDEYNPDDMA